jgi:hypothetical protein
MALGLRMFMKMSVSPDIFWINFEDIKMKLGMVVYNNELQISFDFCSSWSIIDRVMALGLRIFIKISVFRTFLELIWQILK